MSKSALILVCIAAAALSGCRTPGSARTQSLIGKQAPDFTLADLRGQEVTLSALRGKPVVVAFFGYG